MPIAQDASWADRPQEEEDYEAQPTPTPQASSAFRRLRKGPRPQVSAEDIPAASAAEGVPQDPTPLSHQEAVLQENALVTDPPASQVEDENREAATTTNEANVEPSPAKASEDSEATDPATSVPESAVGPQFNYHVEHKP